MHFEIINNYLLKKAIVIISASTLEQLECLWAR